MEDLQSMATPEAAVTFFFLAIVGFAIYRIVKRPKKSGDISSRKLPPTKQK